MDRIFEIIDSVNDRFGKFLSYFNIGIVGIVCWEIVARYVFNAPTLWASEGMVMLTGLLYALTGGYAQFHKRHVRIDLLYDRLSPRRQAICDGVTYIFFCFFMFALVWAGTDFAWDSVRIRETSGTPWNPFIYPLKCAIPVSAFLIWIQMTADVVRRWKSFLKGSTTKGKEI